MSDPCREAFEKWVEGNKLILDSTHVDLRDALIGYSAAWNASRWIPVSERLPHSSDNVLVWESLAGEHLVGWYSQC